MEGLTGKDTMEGRLQRYLPGRGFYPVNLHVDGMSLYYRPDGTTAVLVWIIGEEALTALEENRYRAQYETIRGLFSSKGFQTIHTMTLFLSSDILKARTVGEGTPFWIVDETYGRLVIYENQPEEFMGLRSMIEQNLHFGADVRNENGMQRTGAAAPAREIRTEGQRTSAYSGIRSTAGQGSSLTCIVTVILVAANLIVFFFEQKHMDVMVQVGANSWVRVKEDREYYRLFTCMFLHGGMDHIFGNMMTLFFVGSVLEERMGHIRYLITYILSGLLASVASCCYHMWSNEAASSIGASGAIYGILGALTFLLLVNRDRRDSSTLTRLVVFGAYMIIRVIASLDSNIDNAAHVGGFIAGTLLALILWLTSGGKLRNRI